MFSRSAVLCKFEGQRLGHTRATSKAGTLPCTRHMCALCSASVSTASAGVAAVAAAGAAASGAAAPRPRLRFRLQLSLALLRLRLRLRRLLLALLVRACCWCLLALLWIQHFSASTQQLCLHLGISMTPIKAVFELALNQVKWQTGSRLAHRLLACYSVLKHVSSLMPADAGCTQSEITGPLHARSPESSSEGSVQW